jgi:cytochrome c5
MGRICLFLIALPGLAATSIVVADNHSTPGQSGEAVFEANCANCHTGGIGGFFTGAPEIGDQDDWESLVPKGIDGLTATTLSGIGKMEPRGECTTCTDEEIRAAIEYMLEKSQ